MGSDAVARTVERRKSIAKGATLIWYLGIRGQVRILDLKSKS
jgi:hypothetical protein